MPAKAVILAAGKGIRLRPITAKMPKCMIRVAGKPVLQHNLEWIRSFGINEFVINLHYRPEAVRSYFLKGRKWDLHITYFKEENLLGTAGTVKRLETHLNETFLVWYGDNLSTCAIDRLSQFHRRKGGLATIAVFWREDPTSSGILGFDDSCRIQRFLEKPKPDQVFSHWISAGIFLLEPEIVGEIPCRKPLDFGHDVFPELLRLGVPLYAYPMSCEERAWWIDTPEDLTRVKKVLLDGFPPRFAELSGRH